MFQETMKKELVMCVWDFRLSSPTLRVMSYTYNRINMKGGGIYLA